MEFAKLLIAEEANLPTSTGWLHYANSCFIDKDYQYAAFAISQYLDRNCSEMKQNGILASVRDQILSHKMFNKKFGLQRIGGSSLLKK